MSPPASRMPRDLAGVVLGATALGLLVALWTYDPADPIEPPVWPVSLLYQPDVAVFPQNEQIQNACGYWGGLLAGGLLTGLGVGAWLVPPTLAVLAARLWWYGAPARPGLRSFGWSLTLASLCALAALAGIGGSNMPTVGGGGHLGAALQAFLNAHFAAAGGWILSLTAMIFGLLLWTEYLLVHASWWAAERSARAGRASLQQLGRNVPREMPRLFRGRAADATPLDLARAVVAPAPASLKGAPPRDEEQEDEELLAAADEEETEIPIKIRGKTLDATRNNAAALVGQSAQVTKPANAKQAAAEPTKATAAALAPPTALANAAPPSPDHEELDEEDEPLEDGYEDEVEEEYEEGEGDAEEEADEEDVDWEEEEYEEDTDEYEEEEDEDGDEDADADDEEYAVGTAQINGEERAIRRDPPHRDQKASSREEQKRESLLEDMRDTPALSAADYLLPQVDLLTESEEVSTDDQAQEVRRKAKILEKTFADFGFNVRVVEIETGPVIAQYEVELEAGLRLSKITGLADDLAIALRVPSVRIVAPIPGKNTVGIEVPNETRMMVRLREVIEESGAAIRKMKIPIFLGKDVSGNPLTVDLASMPHLLIAGRTGTGKSVCLNSIITSILMTRRPDEVRMLMIDPKMVELSGYGTLPHLMHPVVTDMKRAEAILAWAVEKMEERYQLLARAGVRHLVSYNQLGREELIRRLKPADIIEENQIAEHLPFIVIIADEMADLMMTAGKEVEQHIIRLAQKSRAVGIHLILATQKPTVDVITGLIKSNLPARISFQVASRTDSRVVLDENGADRLLGNGDMLFLWPGTSTLLRGQGTYLGDEEIERVVKHCSQVEQDFASELMNLQVSEGEGASSGGAEKPTFRKRDELYESAVEIVIREGRGSVSLLQRALGIGYGRAARLVDFMAEDGIVGEYNGSQAREVVITQSQWDEMRGAGGETATASAGDGEKPARRNRIARGAGWDERDQ